MWGWQGRGGSPDCTQSGLPPLFCCGSRIHTGVAVLMQALPTHRWERRYRYGVRESRDFPDVFRAIRPDATFVLKHPDRWRASFVLEFERRAKNPSTIAPKIEKYRTYYASSDTRRDFLDGRPTVLFVFEAREDASKFARHAATDGGSPVPMLVSSLDDLESAGSVFRDWKCSASGY